MGATDGVGPHICREDVQQAEKVRVCAASSGSAAIQHLFKSMDFCSAGDCTHNSVTEAVCRFLARIPGTVFLSRSPPREEVSLEMREDGSPGAFSF